MKMKSFYNLNKESNFISKFDFKYYTNNSVILKRLQGYADIDYSLIGFDIPTEESSELKFWQEIGYLDGECAKQKNRISKNRKIDNYTMAERK